MNEVRYPRLLRTADFKEKRRIIPCNYSLTLLKNDISTAHLGIPEGDALPAVLDFVELYTLRGSAGIFRVYQRETPAVGNGGCDLRHAISTLHDSVWNNQQDEEGNLLETEFAGTAGEFLSAILGKQKVARWQAGSCACNDTYKRNNLNHDHLDTLLFEMMRQLDGYMLVYDFSTSPWTVSIAACGDTVDAELRETRNLKDGRHRSSRDGMVNRLYLSVHTTEKKETVPETWSGGPNAGEPTEMETADEDKTTETTTWLGVYNDTASQSAYGVLEGPSDVDIADVPGTLAEWVQAYFRDHAQPIQQASADGYEIVKSTGEPWDQFDLGKRARIALSREGFPAEGPIEQVRYSDLLNEPEKAHVELTRKLPGLAERISGIQSAADAANKAATGAGYGAAKAKEVTHWAQVVQHIQELIEGTGVKEMWESGIEMDAEQGTTIYSLYEGLGWSMATLKVTNSSIEALVQDVSGMHSEIAMTSSQIYSEVGNTVSSLYSHVTQTADGLRADVSAAESSLYSYVSLTASGLYTEVGNTQSGLYSAISQTEESIQASVWAAESALYAYVNLTASGLKSEIGDAESGLYSSITQSAEGVQASVWAAESALYSYVNLSVSGLRSTVADWNDDLWSEISQSASQIALKVSRGEVATQLAVEAGNVSISNGNLVVDGMITSAGLATEIASISGPFTVTSSTSFFSGDVGVGGNLTVSPGAVISDGGQFTTLYFGSSGDNDIMDAVKSVGPATESNGQITIPWATFRETKTPINFNIAATQAYIDGVAAAEAGVTITSVVNSDSVSPRYRSNTNTYQITMRATASNGNTGSGTYNLAAPTVQSVSAGTPVYDAST
ncbi:MAG: hypothetical protein J5556_06960, partial [Deltaproteobacteria bacterium]|nr:hypothetical protein [Deltaproteobacteria bacterium]